MPVLYLVYRRRALRRDIGGLPGEKTNRNRARGGTMSSKTVLIGSESLGQGDEQLGRILMASFLRLLGESSEKPGTLVFWNGLGTFLVRGRRKELILTGFFRIVLFF